MTEKIVGKNVKYVCPECGCAMEGLNPDAHALSHWPDFLEPNKSSRQARKRQTQVKRGGVTMEEYNKEREEGV